VASSLALAVAVRAGSAGRVGYLVGQAARSAGLLAPWVTLAPARTESATSLPPDLHSLRMFP